MPIAAGASMWATPSRTHGFLMPRDRVAPTRPFQEDPVPVSLQSPGGAVTKPAVIH
jgi:hypothetical protein